MDELAWMNALAKSIGDSERGKQEKPQCPEAEAHDLLVRYRKLQEKGRSGHGGGRTELCSFAQFGVEER